MAHPDSVSKASKEDASPQVVVAPLLDFSQQKASKAKNRRIVKAKKVDPSLTVTTASDVHKTNNDSGNHKHGDDKAVLPSETTTATTNDWQLRQASTRQKKVTERRQQQTSRDGSNGDNSSGTANNDATTPANSNNNKTSTASFNPFSRFMRCFSVDAHPEHKRPYGSRNHLHGDGGDDDDEWIELTKKLKTSNDNDDETSVTPRTGIADRAANTGGKDDKKIPSDRPKPNPPSTKNAVIVVAVIAVAVGLAVRWSRGGR